MGVRWSKEAAMIVYTNRIVNYQRHMQLEAKKLISDMSESQKQHLQDSIRVQQSVNILTNQQYDNNMLHYVERLLQTNEQWNTSKQYM